MLRAKEMILSYLLRLQEIENEKSIYLLHLLQKKSKSKPASQA